MSTSPLSPEDIRAAAETYHELGPEYSDAVVASFIEKVDREVAARVAARLSGAAPPPARRGRPPLLHRRGVRDLMAAGAGALAAAVAAAGIVGLHSAAGHHPAVNWQAVAGQHGAVPQDPSRRFSRETGGQPRIQLMPQVPAPPQQ